MQGKVALEEHFAIPETLQDSAGFVPGDYWKELQHRLLDIQDTRLKLMDAHGIETMILSLNAPAVQAIPDKKKAIEIARRANDVWLKNAPSGRTASSPSQPCRCRTRMRRPRSFSAASTTSVSSAHSLTASAKRAMARHRFITTCRNIVHSGARWKSLMCLSICIRAIRCRRIPASMTATHGCLAPRAFAQETAVHALRLMASGLFDEHPRLNIILGHMGEGLPYMMWRIDHRNARVKLPPRYPAKRRFMDYFNENFHITTSGNFRTQTLIDAILEIGADRILFSTDWPFENIDHASDWFNATSIAEADRVKIARTNARRLFKLDGA